jgi:hypothetical protein
MDENDMRKLKEMVFQKEHYTWDEIENETKDIIEDLENSKTILVKHLGIKDLDKIPASAVFIFVALALKGTHMSDKQQLKFFGNPRRIKQWIQDTKRRYL